MAIYSVWIASFVLLTRNDGFIARTLCVPNGIVNGDDVDISLTGTSITFKSASTGTATSDAGPTDINKVQ